MRTQGHEDGAVTGAVRFTMQSEGLAVCAAAVLIYFRTGYSWQEFALLFLAPDLSMLGYLVGPRFGAFAYNAAHSYVGPAAMAIIGLATNAALLLPLALIWAAHIGLDRMLGYGLKYRTGFGHTHLGHVGRT